VIFLLRNREKITGHGSFDSSTASKMRECVKYSLPFLKIKIKITPEKIEETKLLI
jgi:hypothetical protein